MNPPERHQNNIGVNWTIHDGDPFPDQFNPDTDTINGLPWPIYKEITAGT